MTTDDIRRRYQSGVSNAPETAGFYTGTIVKIESTEHVYVRVPRLTGTFENKARSVVSNLSVGDQVFVSLTEGKTNDFIVVGRQMPGSILPTKEPTGFADRDDTTITFSNATRTFTITPTGDFFDIWVGGLKYIKYTAESIVIPNVSNIYYIYYDASGVLSYKTTFFDLANEAPVAYVYWNSVDAIQYYFADERHGFAMDWATHEYLHRTRGAAFSRGLMLTSYTTSGDGSSNAHAQVSLTDGVIYDEDIAIDIIHAASPTPNTWEQRINGPGYFPVFYRLGNIWHKDVATAYPIKFTTLANYNLNTAGVWSAATIPNNKFGVYWLAATNNLSEPVISIMGQESYNTVNSAEAITWEDMDITGLPIYEFRLLWKLIFETANGYSNAVKSRLVGVTDYRRLNY